MTDIMNESWKTPVWKVSKAAGQVKRILRVKEAQEVINHIDTRDQGLYKIMELSNRDARTWLFTLLLTGMRLSELIRLKQNPIDGSGNSLLRENGTILLSYEQFGLVGKQKIIEKERVVSLPYKGREIVKEFLDDKTKMPRFKNGFNPEYIAIKFDALLKASADKIHLPTRVFQRTQKKPALDQNGIQKLDLNNKPKYDKIQIPQTTTGVMIRSFRASYESWLITSRGKDEFTVLNILNSIGHNRETATGYYLATQFDEDDIADMLRITDGFGNFKEQTNETKETKE